MSTVLCNYKKVVLIRPSFLLQRQKFPQNILCHMEFIKRLQVEVKEEISIICPGPLGIQEMPPNQAAQEELESSLGGLVFMDFGNVESHSESINTIINSSTSDIFLILKLPYLSLLIKFSLTSFLSYSLCFFLPSPGFCQFPASAL